jgi:hypothetical protein
MRIVAEARKTIVYCYLMWTGNAEQGREMKSGIRNEEQMDPTTGVGLRA